MRVILLVLTLTLWTPAVLAQNAAQIRECEDSASTDEDRAGCARLAQCASQCGSDDACMLTCTAPGRGADISLLPAPPQRQSVPPRVPRSDNKPDLRDRTALCKQLYDFRDHRLFDLWEKEQRKYAIFTAGSEAQVKLRDATEQLMDKEWWAGSTGAAVAVEIKGYTDIVGDVVAFFVPAEQVVVHGAEEIARTVTGVGVLATYVNENAKAAALQGNRELVARYGGSIGSATKLLLDTADYAKNKKDAADYEDIVQDQVRRINQTLRMLDDRRKAAVEHADAYQQIVQGIDRLCASSQQTQIGSPP